MHPFPYRTNPSLQARQVFPVLQVLQLTGHELQTVVLVPETVER